MRVSLSILILFLAGCVSATKGPIPESAWRADGTVDMSQVPAFIPAAGDDANVGWIASGDVLPAPGEAPAEIVTVFADDLTTTVGHMHPGIGFVPVGTDVDSIEPADEDRTLSILVRNESDEGAILDIIEAPDEADGPPLPIAPPVGLGPGEERLVDFIVHRDRWALRLRGGDGGFLYSDALGDHSGGLVMITAGSSIELRPAP